MPPYIRRQIRQLKTTTPREGAPPSKGWSVVAPRGTKQRSELIKECGPACFLQPDRLKYPICPQIQLLHKDDSGRLICAIDCRGLHGAKSRASQHARSLLPKIEKLIKKHGCQTKKQLQKRSDKLKKAPSIEPSRGKKTVAKRKIVPRRLLTRRGRS